MTSTEVIIGATPFAQARRYAGQEIHGRALPGRVQWLRAYPLLWLRALVVMQRETQSQIAKAKADLASHRPKPGQRVTVEYVEMKAQVDLRVQVKLHFLELVQARIEEVKSVIGSDSMATRLLVGDMVAAWVELAEMIEEGDFNAARDYANYWADKWAAHQGEDSPAATKMAAIRQRYGTRAGVRAP